MTDHTLHKSHTHTDCQNLLDAVLLDTSKRHNSITVFISMALNCCGGHWLPSLRSMGEIHQIIVRCGFINIDDDREIKI